MNFCSATGLNIDRNIQTTKKSGYNTDITAIKKILLRSPHLWTGGSPGKWSSMNSSELSSSLANNGNELRLLLRRLLLPSIVLALEDPLPLPLPGLGNGDGDGVGDSDGVGDIPLPFPLPLLGVGDGDGEEGDGDSDSDSDGVGDIPLPLPLPPPGVGDGDSDSERLLRPESETLHL
jgi:hypothetical protein